MPRLRVSVKSYVRKDGRRVGGHTRFVKDRGAPGRTPKKERWFKPVGRLAYKGYEWHADNSAERRQVVLDVLVSHHGYAAVIRRLNALRNVSTSRVVDAATKADMEYLRRVYRE